MASTILHSRLPAAGTFLPDDFSCTHLEELPEKVQADPFLLNRHPFLLELIEVELLRDRIHQNPPAIEDKAATWQVSPGVELLEVSWSGFPELLNGESVRPEKKKSLILLVPQSSGSQPKVVPPDNHSLLALKIVTEHLDLIELAGEVGSSVSHLQNILKRAAANGIIREPPSTIARPADFCGDSSGYENFFTAGVFTLQWHITQSCDLHCRHCYDRTTREEVALGQGKEILDQFYLFCRQHNVAGQVSFTGGNPLLHPHFFELYRSAVDRGFMTAILGNPTTRGKLQRILDIRMPEFFQVSLEGLAEHNDYIRGRGHFDRVIHFLELLKDLNIYSMVMLTLTRANQAQVLPLAERLRSKVDLFTFNRLAMVGEGAGLASADREDFRSFLESYQRAAQNNPAMRLKDNLFNIIRCREGTELTGGCTGYGCGAAFNFVSLLPDGQVHACRKFPSLIGDINKHSLSAIYESRTAEKYRRGCSNCYGCKIRPVCGGCLAVSHGFGTKSLVDPDPYCFMNKKLE